MIRVGIFTKMNMAGGSEFRAVEMATALSELPGHQAVLFVEKTIAPKLRPAIGEHVEVHESIFANGSIDTLYAVDHLLVINSDSRDFTTLDHWQGRTTHHACAVDLSRIKQMVFLFNFLVSPARHLPEIRAHVPGGPHHHSQRKILSGNQRAIALRRRATLPTDAARKPN